MEHSISPSYTRNKLIDYAGIPAYVLRILGDLETQSPISWNLQRNVDRAITLTLSFSPRTPKANIGNRRPPPPSRKLETLRKTPSTVTCEETPSNLLKKRKSPSCAKRDRKRHDKWIRKFHPSDTRSCDKGHPPQDDNTNQKVPESLPSAVSHDTNIKSQKSSDCGCLPDSADSNPTVTDNMCGEGEDSLTTTKEPEQLPVISQISPESGCLPDCADANLTVKDTLCKEGEDSDTTTKEPAAASRSDVLQSDHLELDTMTIAATTVPRAADSDSLECDSDDDSESECDAEEYCDINLCAYCSKMSDVELKKCSKCKVFRYCTRECQIWDWPRHKSVCKLFQAD